MQKGADNIIVERDDGIVEERDPAMFEKRGTKFDDRDMDRMGKLPQLRVEFLHPFLIFLIGN